MDNRVHNGLISDACQISHDPCCTSSVIGIFTIQLRISLEKKVVSTAYIYTYNHKYLASPFHGGAQCTARQIRPNAALLYFFTTSRMLTPYCTITYPQLSVFPYSLLVNDVYLYHLLQHSVLNYIQGMLFHGYLDQAPKLSLPSSPAHPPGGMAELKPSVRAVDICHHGNETAVVLEGENLWFCHQVTVGGHHELLPAQKATASSIQFSLSRQDNSISIEDGRVEICLQDHFSRPIKESVEVNVEVSFKSKLASYMHNWASVSEPHTCDFNALYIYMLYNICDRHCTSKLAINISIFHLGSHTRRARILPRRGAVGPTHFQSHCPRPPGPSCELTCSLCSSGIVLQV